MRLMQFVVVAILVIFAQSAFAQGTNECMFDEAMDEIKSQTGKNRNLISRYIMHTSLDRKHSCNLDDVKSIDMSKYKELNVQIEKILRKHNCTWDDDLGIRRIETAEDICREDHALALVPLVPYAKEQCVTAEFSRLVVVYNKAFEKDSKDCSEVNLEKYRVWNAELDIVLKKANCTWDDINGLKRVKTHADLGCKEPEKKVVADTKTDDNGPEKLKIVPLPDPKKAVVKPPLKKPTVITKVPVKLPSKEPAVTITKVSPVPRKSYWLTYTGIGVGVAGLAILGGGAYFGLQANKAEDNAWSAVTQVEVIRFNQNASIDANKANVMFGVGGAAVAAGIVMVILDLTVWGSPTDTPAIKPATSINIGPGSAHLTVRF